jgi:hypothetical protein
MAQDLLDAKVIKTETEYFEILNVETMDEFLKLFSGWRNFFKRRRFEKFLKNWKNYG